MKIATWNVERLKFYYKKHKIEQEIAHLQPDILVLTETDERVFFPEYPHQICSKSITNTKGMSYKKSEKRVQIFTKYKIQQEYTTLLPESSICVKLHTYMGNLMINRSIIGVFGNRHENFNLDLYLQLFDIQKFSMKNNICWVRDFNISFSGNYYFTKIGRQKLENSFHENH